jgi:hypothetical protein
MAKDQTRHRGQVKSLRHTNRQKSDRINQTGIKTGAKTGVKASVKASAKANDLSAGCIKHHDSYNQAVNYLRQQYYKCLKMLGELATLGESYHEEALAHAERVEQQFDDQRNCLSDRY